MVNLNILSGSFRLFRLSEFFRLSKFFRLSEIFRHLVLTTVLTFFEMLKMTIKPKLKDY